MRAAVGILQAQDASVVGFQEFQGPQYATFHAMAPDFQVYPGWSHGLPAPPELHRLAHLRLGAGASAQTTPIPYFYNRVAMPQVLLRNVHTGREVWFGNFHNPADKFHPAQGARIAATAVEAAMTRGFVADGYPVILTGDMNERESYFCRISTLAPLHGADGAYRDAAGCHTVSPTPVDWIIGSDVGAVQRLPARHLDRVTPDQRPLPDQGDRDPAARAVAQALPPGAARPDRGLLPAERRQH